MRIIIVTININLEETHSDLACLIHTHFQIEKVPVEKGFRVEVLLVSPQNDHLLVLPDILTCWNFHVIFQ